MSDCNLCGHDYDGHVLVATGSDPADGGVMLCPVEGCACFGTWAVNDLPVLVIPEGEELTRLRAGVQERWP